MWWQVEVACQPKSGLQTADNVHRVWKGKSEDKDTREITVSNNKGEKCKGDKSQNCDY